MSQANKQSQTQLGTSQIRSQIFKGFYKLQYPNKRSQGIQLNKFRSKSSMAISQHYNPQIGGQSGKMKRRESFVERVAHQNHNFVKSKDRKHKQRQFSFKRMLSGQNQRRFLSQYFVYQSPKYLKTLQKLTNQNFNINQALQKCKDDRSKIAKLLASQKYSKDTKMEYLQKNRSEIQKQKSSHIKAIYAQFFKNEYEQVYGEQAQGQFQVRINQTVELLRGELFRE